MMLMHPTLSLKPFYFFAFYSCILLLPGINVLDNRAVAIKFEPKRTEAPQLRDEYKSYKLLAGTTGIPAVYYYGQEGAYNCLVIDLLGHSLEDLFDFCGRRFTLKTVCMLAKQMVSIEYNPPPCFGLMRVPRYRACEPFMTSISSTETSSRTTFSWADATRATSYSSWTLAWPSTIETPRRGSTFPTKNARVSPIASPVVVGLALSVSL